MLHIIVDGEAVELNLRENPRAKRMVLRIHPNGEGLVVTLPRRVSQEKALAFAQSHSEWVREKLRTRPKRILFVNGASIPFRGSDIRLVHEVGQRNAGRLEGKELFIGGNIEHISRRTQDWLKSRCREFISQAVHNYSTLMQVKPGRICLRDTSTRWGSCSPDGTLSFSWRLIFAPTYVLEYVAAHEVAHLIEMNHGPKFWRLVETHFPQHAAARAWLKQDGGNLHLIG